MTAISKTIRGWGVQLPLPKVFDVTVHYEPSAHFRFTRKIRNDFDELAREHAQSTWLLGSHGGKARACKRIYRASGWLRGLRLDDSLSGKANKGNFPLGFPPL